MSRPFRRGGSNSNPGACLSLSSVGRVEGRREIPLLPAGRVSQNVTRLRMHKRLVRWPTSIFVTMYNVPFSMEKVNRRTGWLAWPAWKSMLENTDAIQGNCSVHLSSIDGVWYPQIHRFLA